MTATTTTPRRLLSLVGAVAIIALAVFASWRLTRQGPAEAAAPRGHQHGAAPASDSARPIRLSERDQQRIGVTFAAVEAVPLTRVVRIVAQVTWDETRVVAVSPRVEGFVEKLDASYTGQEVRAGEPLLELYSPMVSATAEELRVAAKLAEELADGPEESRASAERLVRAARQRLLAWNVPAAQVAHVEEHGMPLPRVALLSPASGVILEKNVLLGQRVMEGEPLYRIADLGVVWIEGEVFEQDLAAARVGQQVEVEFQALPGVIRRGRITYVYPTLSRETRTGRVRVAMPNSDHTLKPGMFATLRFRAAATGPVLSVPRSAILSTGERSLVFVRSEDGRFTPVEVVLGAQTEERVEVRRGLAAGDLVVASATFLVDAESNLGSLFGGMGDMPGMDLTAPSGSGATPVDTGRHAPAPPMQMPMPPAPATDTAHQHQHGGT